MSDISVNAGAMIAFGEGVGVTAHNIANINTEDFRSWSRVYTSQGAGEGVRAHVRPGGTPASTGDRVTLSSLDGLEPSDEPSAAGAANGMPGTNTVDAGREMANLLADQRAFEANAAVISTRDEMDAGLLGMVADRRV